MKLSLSYTVLAALGMFIASCGDDVQGPQEPPLVPLPAGFPALPVPAGNQLTADRIALGKKLFYDKQLSSTSEVACANCHLQENAFADPLARSIGVHGRTGTRNAPMLANLAYNTSFFWDGGAPTLEQQAIAPIINPLEMDMKMEDVAARLAQDPGYVNLFKQAYDTEPRPEAITKAIASFIRTMVSGNSRYDKYQRGDASALNESEQHGLQLFMSEQAECFHCHIGFNFTNNNIQNNGFYRDGPDMGRFLITENPIDAGSFKVPSLRNIAVTAPYMHDGSLATLEDVMDHYMSGGKGHPNTDPVIRAFELTPDEKADLIAFLKSLTDDEFLSNPKFKP